MLLRVIKIKKWMKIAGIIVLVLLLIAGYTGFVPVISDLMGTNSPRDLGVKYTKEDYVNAMQKANFELDSSAGYGPETKISYQGKQNIDTTFTQEEISALISFDHAENYPARDAQVKINEDGSIEVSAKIKIKDYKGYSLNNAVYVKGKAELSSPNRISLTDVDEVEIGRLPAPVTDSIINEVEQEINDRISRIPGLYIESVNLEKGAAGFKGTIPESAKRVPR